MPIKNHHTLLLLILFLPQLMVMGCKKAPDEVEVVMNYGDGAIKTRYTTIDGKKEGKMIDYYPDGSLKAEHEFRNDTQVGKSIFYYPSGKRSEIQFYEDGELHGGDSTFYEDGSPLMLVTYDRGQKHGYVRKWDTAGVITYEAKFDHEKLVEVKGQPVHQDSIQRMNADTLWKK